MKQDKQSEIFFFNALAEGGYDLDSLEYYDYLFKLFDRYIGEKKFKGLMLEAGCATGVAGKKITAEYEEIKVIAVDISPKMVKENNKERIGRYRAMIGDLENTALFKENTFDFIFCPGVLHHFPSLELVMNNFGRWAKREAWFILAEPNGSNIVNIVNEIIKNFLLLIFGKLFLMKQGFSTPNENIHTIGKYLKFLKKIGFTARKIDAGFNFLEYQSTKKEKAKIFSLCWLVNFRLSLYKILLTVFPNSKFSGPTVVIIARRED